MSRPYTFCISELCRFDGFRVPSLEVCRRLGCGVQGLMIDHDAALSGLDRCVLKAENLFPVRSRMV